VPQVTEYAREWVAEFSAVARRCDKYAEQNHGRFFTVPSPPAYDRWLQPEVCRLHAEVIAPYLRSRDPHGPWHREKWDADHKSHSKVICTGSTDSETGKTLVCKSESNAASNKNCPSRLCKKCCTLWFNSCSQHDPDTPRTPSPTTATSAAASRPAIESCNSHRKN
jgi:hypothetical protein